jgi:anti-sigma B factor antagonist
MSRAGKHNESSWRIRLEGSLTLASAAESRARLLEGLSSGKALELNLEHIAEVDAAGLQLLWCVVREAEEKSVPIACRVSEAVAAAGRDAGFPPLPSGDSWVE